MAAALPFLFFYSSSSPFFSLGAHSGQSATVIIQRDWFEIVFRLRNGEGRSLICWKKSKSWRLVWQRCGISKFSRRTGRIIEVIKICKEKSIGRLYRALGDEVTLWHALKQFFVMIQWKWCSFASLSLDFLLVSLYSHAERYSPREVEGSITTMERSEWAISTPE